MFYYFDALTLFWIEIILILILIITTILTYRNRFFIKDNEFDKNKKILSVLGILFLCISTYHITGLQKQGFQKIFSNPYLISKASKNAPKPNQVTEINRLNSLSDEEKLKATVIVFKFGCPDCQRLWLKSNTLTELKPSDTVLWVSNKDYNKENSELVKNTKRYPTIIQWVKINDEIKPIYIQEPSEDKLYNIVQNIKK